jgi:small-conductance mechanosensitive channel
MLSLAILLGAFVAYFIFRRVIKKRIKDVTQMHALRSLVKNALILVTPLLIFLVWLTPQGGASIVIGLLVVGIVFALQSAIRSFTGYLTIVTGNVYAIGDRIAIADVVGDVMDIGFLRTTVMEIGQWVKADQYTGRIVTISNKAIFDNPVFNYNRHWKYLWDEIMVPVTYNSD